MSKADEAIRQMRKKREQTARKIGMFLQGQAAENVTRLTGELARSITNEIESTDKQSVITVGSNKEYAATQELGSPKQNIKGQLYITRAIEDNVDVIQSIIKEGMS